MEVHDFMISVFVEELFIKKFLAFMWCESCIIEDPIWRKVNSAKSINALYKIPFNVILPQFRRSRLRTVQIPKFVM